MAALPRDLTVFRDSRRVGSEIAYEIGDYDGNHAGMRAALAGSDVLTQLFGSPWTPDPRSVRISEPYSVLHYALRSSDVNPPPQYIVRSASRPPPAGTTAGAATTQATLYVRDLERWQRDKSSAPPLAPRSRFYDVKRTSLFSHLGLPAGVAQVDLFNVARRAKALVSGR